MQRVFIIGWSAVIIVCIGLMVLLYVSLIPFFRWIGLGATVVLFIGLGCLAVLVVSWTRNRVLIWSAEVQHKQLMSRVVVAGELVAMPMIDGSVRVLSAEHEAAKVQPMYQQALPSPQPKEGPLPETVLELYDHGRSLRDIAKDLGTTYYQVQKIVSEAKKL